MMENTNSLQLTFPEASTSTASNARLISASLPGCCKNFHASTYSLKKK
jgi:hypothetical protein